jgi:flagellar biosynthesis anti-sigma factor FlgM
VEGELKLFNLRSILELQGNSRQGNQQTGEPAMRIDLNQAQQPLPETNRNSAASTGVAVNSSASNALGGEDQAQLSGAHAQVLALVVQASQLPEVRQERVHALRQAIQSGQYQSSPEKVAGAVLAHMISGAAA